MEYLDTAFYHPVRDPVWGNIMLSDGFMRIASSPVLQKMNRIKQLGPTYLVYPGAVHTRFLHSLGVFHIGFRVIRRLLAFESCPKVSEEGVRAFLCACLLHDLGHFPYTHSLKELPLKEHEVLTGEYILSEPLYSLIKTSLDIDPFMAAAIVDENLAADSSEIIFFRKILSGALDPDKLDYLTRDAWFCGVPYGIQDIDFVLSAIYPDAENGIGVMDAGLSALENIYFSKYMMYKTVYWHRTVRCATGMIKKAIMADLDSGALKPEQLYNLDDESLFHVCRGKLFKMVHNRELFKMVHEVVFDCSKNEHIELLDLKKRSEREKLLVKASGCDSDDLFIDVPENINFETSNSTILFKEPLRKLRVFASPLVADQLRARKDIEWI